MTASRKGDPEDMSPIEWGDAWIVNDSLANRRACRKLVAQGYEIATFHPSWWSCVMPWQRRRVGSAKATTQFRYARNYILIVPPINFRAEEVLPWQVGIVATP